MTALICLCDIFFFAAWNAWVDRYSDYKDWTSAVWKLGLFLCSSTKINNRFRVKCLVCEQHHASCVRDYDGTTLLSYHAEHDHPKEPKVAEWLHQKALIASKKKEERADEEHQLGQV